mgnify:CR=1 FL=1
MTDPVHGRFLRDLFDAAVAAADPANALPAFLPESPPGRTVVLAAGKAAAAKGAAGKAAAAATQADALEAAAVLVAGGAVGQTGTSIITKNSRIRKIRITPKGELPLPLQTAAALAVPASFLFTLIAILASL